MGASKRLEIEGLLGARPARGSEPAAKLDVGDETVERPGEVLRVSRLDEYARLSLDDLLRQTAHPRGDDGEPRRHRLEHGHGHPLGRAREREDVGGGEQLGDVAPLAGERHAFCEAEAADLVLEPLSIGAFADDDGVERAGLEPAERPDERDEILGRLQPADGDDQRPLPAAGSDTRRTGDVDRVGDHHRAGRIARARGQAELPLALRDADRDGGERTDEAIGDAVDAAGGAGVGGERPTVDREDPDRDAGESARETSEDAGLRAARVEDVRAVAAEQPDELDDPGHIVRAYRPPHVSERLEPHAGRSGRVTKWACSVSRDDDVEALHERRKQRRHVRLGTPDLRERDQQQDAWPPRPGG